MIDWWLPTGGQDAPDDVCEPPETPAPIFAARAIRSAIFGTPARHSDDEDDEQPQYGSEDTGGRVPTATRNVIVRRSKPQGILMTPGTARSRKTVSFGAAVKHSDPRPKEPKPNSLSGIPDDCPGKFPSPWVSRSQDNHASTPIRKTALTRTLESVRAAKRRQSMDDNAMNKVKEELLVVDCGATVAGDVAQTRNSGKAEIPSPAGRISSHDSDALDTDTTVDLSEPHSQSGRYWKSEYERYQEDAREQMKKLVRYKQLAKSYAKMKDEEALGLSQKLKEEKDKVAQMEDKIAELVAHLQGKGPAESYEVPPELFQDLARQTALAVQYRNHVDRFESTLRKHDKSLSTNARASAPRAVNEKSVRSAPPQQPENHDAMNQLHLEMQALRNQLSAVERKASKLQDHNAALTKDLAKMSLDSSRREERRQTAEKSLSVKDDQLQALQKKYDNLKESAKAQRRDAVYLLKKKHDQVSELRKEIVSLKGVVKSHEKENIRPPMTLKDIT